MDFDQLRSIKDIEDVHVAFLTIRKQLDPVVDRLTELLAQDISALAEPVNLVPYMTELQSYRDAIESGVVDAHLIAVKAEKAFATSPACPFVGGNVKAKWLKEQVIDYYSYYHKLLGKSKSIHEMIQTAKKVLVELPK